MKSLAAFFLFALVAWFFIAQIVFSFRHPWATSTEKLVYIGKVMTFGKVPYNEARPRE